MTRSRHSNVKIEKKKKKKKELCKLAASEPRRLSDLPSGLSCVAACSLLIPCVCLFLLSLLLFNLANLLAASRILDFFFFFL